MERRFEAATFEKGDLILNVNVSPGEKTAWLSLNEMSALFERDKSVISRHIKNIFAEGELNESRTVAKNATVQSEGGKAVKRTIDIYNLDVVIAVGYRVKSQNGILLKEFVSQYLSRSKNADNIVIFENGNVSLPVQVSPVENTVWISKEGLISLFGTSRQNIEYHIANIYGQNELEEGATCKEILQVQNEAGRRTTRTTKLYNLDLIISLGYRVNTKNGIAFRIWATNVLKEYLLKGYAINEARVRVTDENYINLIHRVDAIDSRLSAIESENRFPKDHIFFDGEFFDARSFLKKLLATAEKEVILVDPYADILALDYLKEKKEGVSVELYVSSKSRLTKEDASSFQRQYGALEVKLVETFHDRFIVLDAKDFYHVGASLNYAGRKTFGISKIEDTDFQALLLEKLSRSAKPF